jgi:ribosomal protein L6P/L9E
MQVINLHKSVSIIYHNNNLIIKNHYTHVILKNIKSYIILDKNYVKIFTNYIKNDLTFYQQLNSITNGVFNFFIKKLNLVGIGFKAWVTINKNKQKILTLKFGFSKNIILKISKEVLIFCLRPNLIIVKGPNKKITTFVAAQIRLLKRINVYKGKGILYENEFVQLKPGK